MDVTYKQIEHNLFEFKQNWKEKTHSQVFAVLYVVQYITVSSTDLRKYYELYFYIFFAKLSF